MGQEQIWLVAFCGLAGFLGNVCYMAGGTQGFGLVWRRYAGTFVLTLACNLAALFIGKWVWQYILVFPCLLGGMSLGYGSDITWVKVYKRAIFALGVLMACVVGAWAVGFTASAWIVIGLAFLIGSGSVVLGVLNPFSNAPAEQFLVCQTLTMFVPFLAWIR